MIIQDILTVAFDAIFFSSIYVGSMLIIDNACELAKNKSQPVVTKRQMIPLIHLSTAWSLEKKKRSWQIINRPWVDHSLRVELALRANN